MKSASSRLAKVATKAPAGIMANARGFGWKPALFMLAPSYVQRIVAGTLSQTQTVLHTLELSPVAV